MLGGFRLVIQKGIRESFFSFKLFLPSCVLELIGEGIGQQRVFLRRKVQYGVDEYECNLG